MQKIRYSEINGVSVTKCPFGCTYSSLIAKKEYINKIRKVGSVGCIACEFHKDMDNRYVNCLKDENRKCK